MKRLQPSARTYPRDRRESAALDEREIARRATPEVVTVERQGDRLTFEPKSLAAQLGVRPEHVRVRKKASGQVFVEIYRTMSDSRFGWWEEYAAELLS